MLHDLIAANWKTLVDQCAAKAAARFVPSRGRPAETHGVPLFLQQLIAILRLEYGAYVQAEGAPSPSEIGRAAALHGAEMLRLGYSIDQVVHEYGDVCQAVTEFALQSKADISTAEFRTLNRCLDNAIADAVAAFASQRKTLTDNRADTFSARLESFNAEQLRLIETAIQSFEAIQTGRVGLAGATGTALSGALFGLRIFTEEAMSDIRLKLAMTTLESV